MLVPVGAEVRCRWDEPVEYLHVYFRPGVLEQYALETYGRPIGELQDRSHVRDEQIALVLMELFTQPWNQAPDPLLVDEVTNCLACATLAAFSPVAGAVPERRHWVAPRRMRAVLDLIEDGLDQPLRVADLATAAGLSPSHFGRAFAAARLTGTSLDVVSNGRSS